MSVPTSVYSTAAGLRLALWLAGNASRSWYSASRVGKNGLVRAVLLPDIPRPNHPGLNRRPVTPQEGRTEGRVQCARREVAAVQGACKGNAYR